MIIQRATRSTNVDTADAGVETNSKLPETSFHEAFSKAELPSPAALPSAPVASPDVPPEAALSEADQAAFDVFVEANRRTESGGIAAFSMLATTAGPEHRASFGVGQLTMREHLSRMARLDEQALARIGTSHAEVDAMRSRGDLAIAYYHLVVDGGSPATSRALLRLSRADAQRASSLSEAGDVAGLEALLGPGFTGATGLPASALRELASTRSLLRRELREAFRAQYEHDHGVAFDPGDRAPARMLVTARHVALSHPELRETTLALGTGDSGALALAHYLGVGDAAENMLGWHARAASTATGAERFAAILALADPITSRAREADDFARALAATAGAHDLDGAARAVLLARIGRIFHGAPARARERFFVDGSLDAPRFTSRAELETAVSDMRGRRGWSDERLLGHVADVLGERRTA